jgi:transposase
MRRRYELTDKEWLIIEPLLPNKPRGVPRVDDRRVLNGILWRFRSGAPWAEIPERYGPSTTCYNRFVRWRKAGVWDRLLAAVSAGFNGELVMIDSTCMRVHQHGATGKKGDLEIMAWDVPGAVLRPSSTLLSTLTSCPPETDRWAGSRFL